MAKRITTDAKIVLTNHGYIVEYAYDNGRVIGLDVWTKFGGFVKKIPVNNSSWVENSLVEELLDK